LAYILNEWSKGITDKKEGKDMEFTDSSDANGHCPCIFTKRSYVYTNCTA
jgi:hypothetical protein